MKTLSCSSPTKALLAAALLAASTAAGAADTRSAAEREAAFSKAGAVRLDTSFSYEYLSPNGAYGSWKAFNAALYFPLPGFSAFAQASSHSRREGKGVVVSAGGYKDWTSGFYTYTSLSGGSHSPYLPKFRVDQDFNFKVLPARNLVLTAGVSHIRYHDIHKDLVLSAGPALYLGRLILSAKLMRNISDPGSVRSSTFIQSAGWGAEGSQWTFLTASQGRQAYLATYLADPQEVRQDAVSFTLNHRRWLRKDFGLTGDVSWFELKDGYKKYGGSLGCFYNF